MADLDDFKNIMGPLKEAILDEGRETMDFGEKVRHQKDEKIKDMTDSEANYGKRRFVLYCESGNVYSSFLTPEVVEEIKGRYNVGDVAMITYVETPNKNDPSRSYLNLEGMSEKQATTEPKPSEGQAKPITMTENPLLGQPDMGYDNLPDALPPEHPVLAPESAVEALPTEKLPPTHTQGRGKAPMSLKDVSIVRQVSHKCSSNLLGPIGAAAISAGLFQNADELKPWLKEAENEIAHSIEEDINR